MKQTAVEWLVEQLDLNVFESDEEIADVIDKAKEMEKKQIIEARINGDVNGACIFKIAREKAEQYYNETFKSE